MKKRRLWFFVLIVGFALIISGVPVVTAQEETAGEAKDQKGYVLEEIVVTGSRIAREDNAGLTSPVTAVGVEEIKSFGYTRMEDILNAMPQLEAGQTAFVSNGSTGTATLDLRGLGPERTLVLINGRRMQPGGTSTQYVDVNQIPTSMIERVDVLTGGASATYGADAVAGVVNFIMRKVEGVELGLGISGYQHYNDNGYMQRLMDEAGYTYPTGSSGIDGKTWNIDLAAGSEFANGRGNATLYATWRKNDELRERSRDYSSCALDSTGTACGGSGNAPVPNFYIGPIDADGLLDWNDVWEATLQPDSSLADWTDNLYNYAPPNHFMRPDERWSAGGFADLEINDYATVYMEVMFANDRNEADVAEGGTFFNDEYYLPVDNALFPQTFQDSLMARFPGETRLAFLVGKRNVEGGPRHEIFDHASTRIVGGVRGEITENWAYDLSYLKGRTASSDTNMKYFLAQKLITAVDAEACAADSTCVPYNVFTYGGVTKEEADAQSGTGISANETSIQMVSALIKGNTGVGLPAGDIFVAGGYEWREETYQDNRDTMYETGVLLGAGGPRPSISGEFRVSELFAEANIPLLKDLPAAKDLTADLALRWSDHDITGSDWTYRAGLDYRPLDLLRVRGGYNRAVRSPNIEELFEPRYVNLWSGTDPCAGPTPKYTQEQCARTGVTAAQYGTVPLSPASQYNHLRGGNPNLEPEEADTYTVGIVADPIENLKFTLDYWRIKIDKTIDRIGSESAEIILDICATSGQLCELIHRGGGGNLWIGQGPYVENTMQNVGEQFFEGIDISAAYALDAFRGIWNFNMIGTWMLTKETTPISKQPSSKYDCVGLISTKCFPTPEWRHTASVTYDSQEWWSVTARWRFIGDVGYKEGEDLVVNDSLTAKSYIDLSAVLKFMGKNDIIIGVNNVFDLDAPLVGDTMNLTYGNANAVGLYDPLGRYLYGKVTFRF